MVGSDSVQREDSGLALDGGGLFGVAALLDLRPVPLELRHGGVDLFEGGRGSVVNVASTAAFQPTAYFAVYGASKTFVLNFSLALRHE